MGILHLNYHKCINIGLERIWVDYSSLGVQDDYSVSRLFHPQEF